MGWIVDLGYELLKHTIQARRGAGGDRQAVISRAGEAAQGGQGAWVQATVPGGKAPARLTRPASAPQALKCDVVLVVGDERLYSQLSGELKRGSPGVQVLKLPRSGGVVVRSRELRAAARKVRVEEYFYGMRKVRAGTVVAVLRVGWRYLGLHSMPVGCLPRWHRRRPLFGAAAH